MRLAQDPAFLMRVVVLGGTGNFGARICRALQANPDIEVVSASRRGSFFPDDAGVRSVQLDAGNARFPDALAALEPDLVIHCVGPFQGQDYRVVQAALRARAHYLDLADGRAFVAGFHAANDAQSRAVDRLAISGASTLPALSSAVLDAIAQRMQTLDTIQVAIAPGQRAPRGAATLRSVFSYLGRPFKWLHDGQWIEVHGWQELKRVRLDCGTRWAAACDVPDLDLLPQRYASARTVEFRAALEVGIQHFALWVLAALRRRGVSIPVDRWAVGLDRIATTLDRFGGEYGGMSVAATGTAQDGSRRRICWQLTVPATDGPEIPCMAAILLASRLARGQLLERGAHACMGFLMLCDFESEFSRWGVRTRIEEDPA
jgi:uncharacterized protein YbjT (DUF2867 family)